MKLEHILLIAGAVGVGYVIAKRRSDAQAAQVQQQVAARPGPEVVHEVDFVEVPGWGWSSGPGWWGGGWGHGHGGHGHGGHHGGHH